MENEILFTVIRESVSLGILLVVLVGGYRLLNKTIDLVDIHLGNIEKNLEEIITILEQITDAQFRDHS